jgi:hypothetical protein
MLTVAVLCERACLRWGEKLSNRSRKGLEDLIFAVSSSSEMVENVNGWKIDGQRVLRYASFVMSGSCLSQVNYLGNSGFLRLNYLRYKWLCSAVAFHSRRLEKVKQSIFVM